jgi:dihydroxyacetone kinase-like protein
MPWRLASCFRRRRQRAFYDAMREANGGAGVICLYGNYAGDNMNVKMAIKLAAKDGIEVATVVANDDVCSAPPHEREKRRGVAGEIFMWKIGSAKASAGGSLEEVRAIAQKAIDNCRSIGVGLGPCTCPPWASELSDRARHDGSRDRPSRRARRSCRAAEDR